MYDFLNELKEEINADDGFFEAGHQYRYLSHMGSPDAQKKFFQSIGDHLKTAMTSRNMDRIYSMEDSVYITRSASFIETILKKRMGEKGWINEDEGKFFQIPAYVEELISIKNLGNKTGQGFFKFIKAEKKSLVWDPAKKEYVDQVKPDLAWIKELPRGASPDVNIKAAKASGCKVGKFVWETVKASLVYAANKVPEITDDFRKIDLAIEWGYNYAMGPFNLWDKMVFIGIERIEIGLSFAKRQVKCAGLQHIVGVRWRKAQCSATINNVFSKSHGYIRNAFIGFFGTQWIKIKRTGNP